MTPLTFSEHSRPDLDADRPIRVTMVNTEFIKRGSKLLKKSELLDEDSVSCGRFLETILNHRSALTSPDPDTTKKFHTLSDMIHEARQRIPRVAVSSSTYLTTDHDPQDDGGHNEGSQSF